MSPRPAPNPPLGRLMPRGSMPLKLVEQFRELDHLQSKAASILATQAPHDGAPARLAFVIGRRQDRVTRIGDIEAPFMLDELPGLTEGLGWGLHIPIMFACSTRGQSAPASSEKHSAIYMDGKKVASISMKRMRTPLTDRATAG